MDPKGPSEGGRDSIWTVDVEQNKVRLMRIFVEREDPTSKEADDLMLRRFLRARDLDVEKASALFLRYLKWRRAAIPNGLISESEVQNQLAEKKMFMQGFDKKGRRIGLVFGGKHQSYKRDFEEFKRFVIYTLEKLCGSMQNGEEKFIAIGDLEGWGYSNCDIRAYIAALDIMQFVFVENKNLKSTLLEDIDESELPEIYGGKLPLIPIQDSTA
ncbi:patellin-2-like isoform X2 [Magnolia sinica]|uniref:patellin-2-like isoform X2 n=1 Tax=Magnolia sinica TaxID=86752 RepID=UPI00265887EA|nr:patellin-2-like isoform X2 [Magnolia sinica]